MAISANETKGSCMDVILACFHYNLNPKFLNITQYKYGQALKVAKSLGYTRIQGHGGSGCTCSFNESVNWCECGGAPFVGRYTTLSEEGTKYVLGLINTGTIPTESELKNIIETNIAA